ncbi:MAG: helix-turn-helix transcriptional regulator [Candidatus Buchananbacteria bacterium]
MSNNDGRTIKKSRIKLGLSIDALAVEIGISVEEMRIIENGVDQATLRRVFQVLGIKPRKRKQKPDRLPAVQNIGTVIKQIRKEQGLTQPRLAEKSGLSQSIISMLECGRRRGLNLQTFQAICSALGRDMSEVTRLAEELMR